MTQETFYIVSAIYMIAMLINNIDWKDKTDTRPSQPKKDTPEKRLDSASATSTDAVNNARSHKKIVFGLVGVLLSNSTLFMLARSSMADAPLSNGVAAFIAMSLMLFASSLITLLR